MLRECGIDFLREGYEGTVQGTGQAANAAQAERIVNPGAARPTRQLNRFCEIASAVG